MTLGIDGCKGGWCVAYFSKNDLRIKIHRNISEVSVSYPHGGLIFIDIPIGLEDKMIARDVELHARKLMNQKFKSSLFTPPIRQAIHANNYQDACAINEQFTGKKISLQSWNISGKIKEVDQLLIHRTRFRKSFRESHPEICFKFLNDGINLTHKKNASNAAGIKERLNILSKYYAEVKETYQLARKEFSSTVVKNDDLADALCLAVSAKLGFQFGFHTIYGSNRIDSKGIEMGIHFYSPNSFEPSLAQELRIAMGRNVYR